MELSSVQSAAGISVMKKMMDQQSAVADKLIAGMDQASAVIQANSGNVEPGKGQHFDAYA